MEKGEKRPTVLKNKMCLLPCAVLSLPYSTIQNAKVLRSW